jgi:hypothetical protein
MAWQDDMFLRRPWLVAELIATLDVPGSASEVQTIQEAIGPKTGQVFVSSTQFVAGLIVGFTQGWELSLVICATNFIVGYLIGRPQYGLECSQALGQKNNSFTVYLALTYANPLVALGPTIYVLWHNLWNAWQLYRHDTRALGKKTSVSAS